VRAAGRSGTAGADDDDDDDAVVAEGALVCADGVDDTGVAATAPFLSQGFGGEAIMFCEVWRQGRPRVTSVTALHDIYPRPILPVCLG
jgi:hypothetical protein